MLPHQGLPNHIQNKEKFTGRRLVMLNPESNLKNINEQAGNASLRLATSSDYRENEQAYNQAFGEADGIVFEEFGVAVINENHDHQVSSLTESARTKNTFLYSEPERYLYALNQQNSGFSNSLLSIWKAFCKLFYPGQKKPILDDFDFQDDDVATWGIHAIKALESILTGKGVNIAILDTGFNLDHPDFADRTINAQSFITGEIVMDLNGHGTHCTGIAAGNSNITSSVRYGVAKEANIYIGKVLSNAGSGSDSGILAGLEWAMIHKCKVISMSLGASVSPGETYSNIYNDVAKKLMDKGTIIIAAAGNDSERSMGKIKPVGHPANCPAILAVGALDNRMGIADFSCGGINKDGGQVDIGAPGVKVYSAYKMPQKYGSISGTSMATPFVAGVAALLYEENPNASASEIWMKLTQDAQRLNLPSTDVGSGLVQA